MFLPDYYTTAPAVNPSAGTPAQVFGFLAKGGTFGAINSGVVTDSKPSSVQYLAAGPTCPPLKTVASPDAAIKYKNVPICMDLSKKGSLTANLGPCETYTGYNFQPVGF